MKIVICIVVLVYGLLSMIAPLAQIRTREKRIANIEMLCGGVLLIISAILKLNNIQISVFVMLLGAIMVCTAAIWNGIKNGKVHISHHIVRIAISLALFILYLVC